MCLGKAGLMRHACDRPTAVQGRKPTAELD
eukprot:SAG31_NODE_34883_length_328_cov_0.890830_1_plen_29_part_10